MTVTTLRIVSRSVFGLVAILSIWIGVEATVG